VTSLRRALGDDRGSAPAEFVMVSVLLVALVLAVLQLGFALHIRNTVQSAASEGARLGALAGNAPADGAERTRELVTTAVGSRYAADVSTGRSSYRDIPVLTVTVRTPLPLVGLLGVDDGLEVTGRAPLEDPDR